MSDAKLSKASLLILCLCDFLRARVTCQHLIVREDRWKVMKAGDADVDCMATFQEEKDQRPAGADVPREKIEKLNKMLQTDTDEPGGTEIKESK